MITQQKYDAIPQLVADGVPKLEIAQRYGMTLGSLIVQCSRRGISLSRHGRGKLPARTLSLPDAPLDLEQPVLAKLRAKARTMGTDEVGLIKYLLRTIVEDNLYEAVLDLENV
jgi:hypothetical protein